MTQVELAYRTSTEEVDDSNDLVMQELSQVYYIAQRIRERLPLDMRLWTTRRCWRRILPS